MEGREVTPTFFLATLVGIAGLVILFSLMVVVFRAATTRNDARRAFLSDIIFMIVVALFLCWSLVFETRITYQVAIIAALMSVLSTIAYARIITRGRR